MQPILHNSCVWGYCQKAKRPVRDLSRKRMQEERCRTAQILAIENLMARRTGARMTSEMIKRLGEQQVDGLGFAPDVALAAKANLASGRYKVRSRDRHDA